MISVILPTYGNPDSLQRAIDSVSSQTISEWELFVIDDNNPESENRKKQNILWKDI